MKDLVRITSRENQHLKFARRVRDRKERDFIFVEGKRLCREAVSSGVAIEQVFVSEKLVESDFVNGIDDRSSERFIVSDDLIGSIADTDSPQGIVMIGRRPANRSVDELFQIDGALPLWIFLENPNNPSNLGALFRTAEAAGARGAFLTRSSVDPFTSKTLRASMGSAFRFPIASNVDPAAVFERARSSKIGIVAMDAAGTKDYLEVDWAKPTLLVVGNEAAGLSSESMHDADQVIRIEMKKPVESLNLAVSSGIVLFEAARQARLPDR
jgi:TrmH family RNA methyltransferase